MFSLMLRLEASLKDGQGVLALVLQLGPCRVEPVGGRLLRVRGGSDRPEVVAAIRRAGGERDGTGDFWWLETRNLRGFTACV